MRRTLARVVRRVLHAHVPHHSRVEPVVVGGGYGVAAVSFHSPVGSIAVFCAYTLVAALAWRDGRREAATDECTGRHAACQLDRA